MLKLKVLDKFGIGLLLGLILPVVFGLLFFSTAYKGDDTFWTAFSTAIKSGLPFFGKFILVSTTPDLGLIFLFYKAEYWRASRGAVLATALFFIASFIYMA